MNELKEGLIQSNLQSGELNQQQQHNTTQKMQRLKKLNGESIMKIKQKFFMVGMNNSTLKMKTSAIQKLLFEA